MKDKYIKEVQEFLDGYDTTTTTTATKDQPIEKTLDEMIEEFLNIDIK